MIETTLTKQFIVDTSGKAIAVLLPIAEYQMLERLQPDGNGGAGQDTERKSLFGALRHLQGDVATAEEIDAARDELWSGSSALGLSF